MKKKLIRITTISLSLEILLKGQLSYLNKYYELIGVASGMESLDIVKKREGIRVINVPMRREISIFSDLCSLYKLIILFHEEKPFIVHANTPKASLLSMVAAWITRIPHRVYTVTGLRFETATGNYRKLLIMMEKITCWCATTVIAEGKGVKNTLLHEKITKKPLKVILNGNINGVDSHYFCPTVEIRQQAMIIRKKDFYTYCFVGRLVKDKGINELIYAFIRLNKLYPNTHLLLVGTFEDKLDPLFPEIKKIIEKDSSISFVGYQSDIRPYLAASDVFVFPSYREGFPNAVLQAGAMGLPAIVTDINGCNEIILNNINGEIIPPKDKERLFLAMKGFYENQKRVQKMANSSRSMIIERYEQKNVWEAILKEYQSFELS